MGLDQYLYIIDEEYVDELIQYIKQNNYSMISKMLTVSLAYWRKNYDLRSELQSRKNNYYSDSEYSIFKEGFYDDLNEIKYNDLSDEFYVLYNDF